MYKIFRTTSFKKDYKKLRETDKKLVKDMILKLPKGEKLEERYKDHNLIGNYLGCREYHLKPDLLLIYRINDDVLELALTRVGSHSKLFKK
jgi:mRNA interferase YafQ